MGNILNLLSDSGVFIPIKYYGINDLSTYHDVKNILDNSRFICDYFLNKEFNTELSFNDFIDYLFMKKLIEMKEIILYINDNNYQEKFKELISKIESKYKNIGIGNIIRLINTNIENVFRKKKEFFGIVDITLDLCIKYQKGISNDVFLYIIENYSYLIFDNYDKLQKKIENQEVLFERLFSRDIIEKSLRYRLDKIADIISFIYNNCKKDHLYKYLDVAITTIIDHGESIMNILNIDNIMDHYNTIKEIYNLLKAIRHIKGNEFEKYVEISNNILHQYLEQKGQYFSYNIPVYDIITLLKKDDIPWLLKPLILTHSYNKECNKVVNNLNKQLNNEPSLVDFVSTNIDTDDYFTFSHQQYLDIQMTIGTAVIFSILSDNELFNESFNWYVAYLSFICEQLKYDKDDILTDIELLYHMLRIIFSNMKDLNKRQMQSLCYGASMYICAFTEKILRITYKYMKQEEEYIPSDIIETMGNYLSTDNKVIKEILGEYQIHHLQFYFLTTRVTRIGRNYRNKLAHWCDIDKEELSPQLVCHLFYLMINVINSIFYYFCEKREEK